MKKSLLFAMLVVWTAGSTAQPFGIETRVSNTTFLISELPGEATPGGMEVRRVFPNLAFPTIVFLAQPPGDPNRFFALKQSGEILTFPNDQDATMAEVDVFLDLNEASQVNYGGERGLLGLAFDPGYMSNGEFYVHYTYDEGPNGTTRISRFTNDNPADNVAEATSEEVILSLAQPFGNHNGGSIAFGPDDMLYVGLGDGGSANDPLEAGQSLETLLGKILRVDVHGPPDSGLNYHVPEDNPFTMVAAPGVLHEVYAYGLRNPWRFSFDMMNGTLYAGDVGQNSWEEIDVIEAGGNYGWKIMEGAHCRGNAATCATTEEMILPIAEYVNPTVGRSVTGGYVYYGSEVPSLHGTYLYGDYVSKRIWGLVYDGQDVTDGPFVLVESSGLDIASFGQDASGEVYICDRGRGGLYVLRPSVATPGGSFPRKLSDLPAAWAAGAGIDQTSHGIIPYRPSAELWSDGALKERVIAIPGLGRIGYREYGGWDFPEDTVLVKNFLLPLDERDPLGSAKRVETRFLYKKDDDWHGFAFEWNEEGTDADLLETGKTRVFSVTGEDGLSSEYGWYYPSRTDCMICHTAAENRVLGLNTAQMNADYAYPLSGVTDNQLRAYNHVDLFSEPLPDDPANLPAMPSAFDMTASVQDRARAYLAANCAMCHQPVGPTNSNMDLRWQMPNGETNTIDVEPGNSLGVSGAKVVDPGDPDNSVLLLRMNLRGTPLRMPPLATSKVDRSGTGLIRDWIIGLAPSPTTTPTGTSTPTPTPTYTGTPDFDITGQDGTADGKTDAMDLILLLVVSPATGAQPFLFDFARYWQDD
jgi:uncharacterized repeat protein (TIGR03806 family)